MAFTTLNVSVTNVAGVLVAADAGDTNRRSVSIYNNGTGTIYIGPAATVTVAAGSDLGGFPIPAGGAMTLDRASQGTVYAIAASGSQDVRVFTEEGS